MQSSTLNGRLGAVAIGASLFGLLVSSQPALANQSTVNGFAPTGTVIAANQPLRTFTRYTYITYPSGRQQPVYAPAYPSGGFAPPYGYNGSPYGYNGSPYGNNGSPYGYGTPPYGYGTQPYGYGTASCLNGVGSPYPVQSTSQMLLAPALSAVLSIIGGQNVNTALLSGLTSSSSTPCPYSGAQPYGYNGSPYAYNGSPYGNNNGAPYGYNGSPYGNNGSPYAYNGSPYGDGTAACINGVASPYSTGYPNGNGYPYPAQSTSQMLLAPALSAVLGMLGGQNLNGMLGGQNLNGALLSSLLSTSTACPYSGVQAGYGYPGSGYSNYPSYPNYQPYGYGYGGQQPMYVQGPMQQPIVNSYTTYNVTRVYRVYRRTRLPFRPTFFTVSPSRVPTIRPAIVSARTIHVAATRNVTRVNSPAMRVHFANASPARAAMFAHSRPATVANVLKPRTTPIRRPVATILRPQTTTARTVETSKDVTVRQPNARISESAAWARFQQLRGTSRAAEQPQTTSVERTAPAETVRTIERPVVAPRDQSPSSEYVRPVERSYSAPVERSYSAPVERQRPYSERPAAPRAAPAVAQRRSATPHATPSERRNRNQ